VNLTELLALADRWREAADSRTRYGGEDGASQVLSTCADELSEMLAQVDVPEKEALTGGFLTATELAEWIGGVSPSTVRRWLNEGRFEGAWQLDNKEWRVPRMAALQFVEDRKHEKQRPISRKYERNRFVGKYRVRGVAS